MGDHSTSPSEFGRLLQAGRGRADGLVPVIGAGVAIQAAALDGSQSGGDWAGLLSDSSESLGELVETIRQFPQSFLAAWERQVILSAQAQGIEPFQAEHKLHTRIVASLRELERAATGGGLYREFIDAGFPDIVSLNFDRRLALSSGRTRFVAGPKRPPEGPSGRTLYRHDSVTGPNDTTTRVWYPHGDTRRVDTLRLGIRRYGFHLGLIRERMGLEGNEWRERSWGTSSWEDHEWIKAGDNEDMDTWVDLALSRPLAFLGCGLGSDEWSLWWLLQARSWLSESLSTYLPYVDRPDAGTLALARACDVTLVGFSDFNHLWSVVRGALS